ncbi:MAG: macro domain-containing protein [bacterium]|nr:macro domain-containing protein [bacterium]
MALELEVIRGDITTTDTEAIVNAANNELWMGAGVAGAIKKAAGESVEKEAISKGPVMPGEAVSTTAGRLRFKYVIHGAVMGQDLRTTNVLVRQTTIACLNLAEKLGLESIAFPAFGTGVGGFPMTACANVMVTAARTFDSLARDLRRVQFCLFDDVGYGLFKKVLEASQRAQEGS